MRSDGTFSDSDGVENGKIWLSLTDGTLMLRPAEYDIGNYAQVVGNQYLLTEDLEVTHIYGNRTPH